MYVCNVMYVMYVCLCMVMHAFMYVCIHAFMYACMHVCMYACLCMYYICIYIVIFIAAITLNNLFSRNHDLEPRLPQFWHTYFGNVVPQSFMFRD